MSKSKFLLGMVIGGAAAFGATMLVTPKTGAQIKRKLVDLSDDTLDRVQDYYYYLADATEDLRDELAEGVQELKAQATDFKLSKQDHFENFKTATEELRTDLKNTVENGEFDDILIDGKSAFGQAKSDE